MRKLRWDSGIFVLALGCGSAETSPGSFDVDRWAREALVEDLQMSSQIAASPGARSTRVAQSLGASASEPGLLPSDQASVTSVDCRKVRRVRASAPDHDKAPRLKADRAYSIRLVRDGAGASGYVVFEPQRSGPHTFYSSDPKLPLRITSAGVELTLVASDRVARSDCPGLRRAFRYQLAEGTSYRIELGPSSKVRRVRLLITLLSKKPAGEPPAPEPLTAPIVFAAALDAGQTTDLYTVAADGTGLTRLSDTAASELFPVWSPERDRLAFVRDGQLYVSDALGQDEQLVAARLGRGTQGVTAASWSADGLRLVYPFPRDPFIFESDDEIVDESYATTLHFVNTDGTNDLALIEPAEGGLPPGLGTLIEPAWSTTDVIAFNVLDDCPDCAGGSYYATIRPDGSEFQQVVRADPNDFAEPYPIHGLDWSADGSRWVYTAQADYGMYESPGTIATSTAEYTAARELTSSGAWMPRWSADDSQIAFLRSDGIYVMNADGTDQRRILQVTGVRGIDW